MKLFKLAPLTAILMTLLSVNGCLDDSQADANVKRETVVEVRRVRLVDDGQRLHYSGTIKEVETSPAAFPVAGIVDRVLVKEGEAVHRGQLLATLDDESFRNAYVMAEATYNRAVDAHTRMQPMHQNGTLPEIKWVEAETGLAQAEAALNVARKNLADCELTAGESGIVGRRSIDPGSGAMPGATAISVVQIDQVQAVLSVHEREISLLRAGMEATITVPALGDSQWTGEIDEIGVVADPLSHTYKVKVLIENDGHRILPGMICNVVVSTAGGDPVLVVPTESVMIDEKGEPFVYTADPGSWTARKRSITRGAFTRDGIAVTSGLSEQDYVVIAGQHKLYDGASVQLLNPNDFASRGQQ